MRVTLFGVVATLVAAATTAAAVADLVMEHRPKNGWFYGCNERRSVGGGVIEARRMVDEHGVPRYVEPAVTWRRDGSAQGSIDTRIDWYWAAQAGPPTKSAALSFDAQPAPGDHATLTFTLRRIGDRRGPGLVMQSSGPNGYVQFEPLFAYAGADDRLVWTIDGPVAKEQARSGTIDLSALRAVAAAMPEVRRRLIARMAHFTTACRRLKWYEDVLY